jgi:integrase
MMSATRRKSRKRATPALGPVPQIITRIPRPYPPSAETLGAIITKELSYIWEGILSDSEIRELRSQSVSASGVEKLDALILKQAETLGWRLGLSELVHLRFNDWDFQANGPVLFEKYGKALAKSARRMQKLEPPPIDDPDLYRGKQETVLELRLFLRSLRNAFSRLRRQPSSDELIEYFRTTISAAGDAFIHLKTNSNSWLQFFRADPISVKLLLHGKRAAPATLFDAWLAWGKGFEPETIRQKISELGRFVRDSHQS